MPDFNLIVYIGQLDRELFTWPDQGYAVFSIGASGEVQRKPPTKVSLGTISDPPHAKAGGAAETLQLQVLAHKEANDELSSR